MRLGSVLEAIGETPLVTLARYTPEAGATIEAKLELLNPGGSHKARAALAMISAYERDGILIPRSGQTILEASGGNTGLGIAQVAAVRGYRAHLIVPASYSKEKRDQLRLLGATLEVIESIYDGAPGRAVARLLLQHPDWVLLNQTANPANPDAHRRFTAAEILREVDRVDALVAGAGTGGHLTGVGSVLKEHFPELRIVMVQPEECDLLNELFYPHGLQGLAVGIKPINLDDTLIDEVRSVSHAAACRACVEVARTEGIAPGLSSGANLSVARDISAELGPDRVVLTFIYDSATGYLDDPGLVDALDELV